MSDQPRLIPPDLPALVEAYRQAQAVDREAHQAVMAARVALVDALHELGLSGFTL